MRKIATVKDPDTEIKRVLIYITEEDGTSLYEYTRLEDGPCELDNWYEDPEDAFEYCMVTYGIEEQDWKEIDDPLPNAQHDWIKPVRIKGRDKGKPDWGNFEEYVNGKWVPMKSEMS